MRTLLINAAGVVALVLDMPEGAAAPSGYTAVASESGAEGYAYDARTGALTPPSAPAPSLPHLAAALVSAASASAAQIAGQIVPDRTHELAYLNAAALVGPGATVPTQEPAKAAFAALAAANGFGKDLQAFATLVTGIAAASMTLSALLAGVSAAAGQAKSAADLGKPLAAFEKGLTALLAAINGAGLTVTVAAPAPISIPGIDA